MRQGTKAEFKKALATPHADVRRIIDRRVTETEVRLCGTILAIGTVVYLSARSRKVVGQTYLVAD